MLLVIEFVIAALIVPLALFAPPFGDGWFRWVEQNASRLARHRKLAVLSIFLIALGARLAVLPVEPVPKAWFHDEFSYLLMSDTFAHGRLTNPVHRMWKHFETFDVIQSPTYSAMVYPAQGVFLAFGQKFLGHPFWGVWLSTALMCAAFCWALQGWVPPGWAFLGGILAVMRLGTFSYWADSYWGGSVAALGGALVLGALPRIRRYRRIPDAVVMGVGLAILGNSRPYECIFYATPILLILGWSMLKSAMRIRREYWRKTVVPAGIIVLLTLSAMGYYFRRCTGSPLVPPYLVYVHTYQTVPNFPWQALNRTISYRHPVMAQYELGWLQDYERARHEPFAHLLVRLLKASLFFGGPLLLLPWFVLGVILPYGMSLRDLGYKTALLMKIVFFSTLGMCLPLYFENHYAAPVCCALYALEIQAMRRVSIFDRLRKMKGKLMVRYIVFGCVILFGVRIFSKALHIPSPPQWFRDWESGGGQGAGRSLVEAKLVQDTSQHLVIVDYTGNQDAHSEWVFNAADIDNSKIVWARDMGPQQNTELMHYFKGCKVWLLESGKEPPQLSLYEDAKQQDLTHASVNSIPKPNRLP